MSTHRRMDGENIVIKVRHHIYGESMARKLIVPNKIHLDELDHVLRERFEITSDMRVDLCYKDEDGDRVFITHDDELSLALSEENKNVFELLVKLKVVGTTYLYPQPAKAKPGEVVDVWIASQYLTRATAMKEELVAWGTHIYTDDSDIVKVLAHSEKLLLSDEPPSYNVVATLRFLPGCIKYDGTTHKGITTQSYGAYETSYIVENVRMVSPVAEKNSYL